MRVVSRYGRRTICLRLRDEARVSYLGVGIILHPMLYAVVVRCHRYPTPTHISGQLSSSANAFSGSFPSCEESTHCLSRFNSYICVPAAAYSFSIHALSPH